LQPIIPTAADHFHYPGWNAVENRPLIGTDYPPLVSEAIEWKSPPQSLLRLPLIQVGINTTLQQA
jgi:hypothetical protein